MSTEACLIIDSYEDVPVTEPFRWADSELRTSGSVNNENLARYFRAASGCTLVRIIPAPYGQAARIATDAEIVRHRDTTLRLLRDFRF